MKAKIFCPLCLSVIKQEEARGSGLNNVHMWKYYGIGHLVRCNWTSKCGRTFIIKIGDDKE